MRVDLTINIPTILSVLASIITVAGVGIGLYNGLDKRQLTTEIEVAKISQRIDRTETSIANLKTDQLQQQTALRAEMKGDILEIKDMLNRIIFSSPVAARQPTRQQLDDWRK